MNDNLQRDWRAQAAQLRFEKLSAADSAELERLTASAELLREAMADTLARLRARRERRRQSPDRGLTHIAGTIATGPAELDVERDDEPGELIETPPIPASAVPYRPGDAVLIRHHGQDVACTIKQVYGGLQVSLEVLHYGQCRPVFVAPHQVLAHWPASESRP